MSKTTEEMLADISNDIGVDDDKLSTLSKYGREQQALEQELKDLEDRMKERKAELQRLKTETIPEFMDEIGIEAFTTTDGKQIKIEPFYQCSIPKDRKTEAYSWLKEHGFEDLIKVNVTLTFGKAQYDEAVELCKQLDELGYATVPQLTVHPMTLKGWVRSMAEDGEEFPMDLFGAYIGRMTKIK